MREGIEGGREGRREGGREGGRGREGLGGLVYGLKKNVLHSKAASSEMSRF